MGDGEPTLGGVAEFSANFVESLALGVTAGKCGDRGGVAASVGFWVDNRGEDYSDIDGDARIRSGGTAHGGVPPIRVVYRGGDTRHGLRIDFGGGKYFE
jgi:hypothetical protein